MSTPIILKNPSTNEQELPITSPDCVLDGNGVSVTTKLADKVDYQDIVSTTGSATNKAISQSKYTSDQATQDSSITNLINTVAEYGLSVVSGKLSITYEI